MRKVRMEVIGDDGDRRSVGASIVLKASDLSDMHVQFAVLSCEDGEQTQNVCMKRSSMEHMQMFNRELSILRHCRGHPNILSLVGWFSWDTHVYMVTPMCNHTLRYAMITSGLAPDPRCVMRDMSAAIRHLGERGVLHRDIKPENVVLSKQHQCETWILIDFGLSRYRATGNPSKRVMTPNTCTLWYRPPEVLVRSHQYSESVDVWSLGCVFAEVLMNGMPLFKGLSDINQLELIFHRLGVPGKRWWNEHGKNWPFGVFEQCQPSSNVLAWDDITADPVFQGWLTNMVCLNTRRRILPAL